MKPSCFVKERVVLAVLCLLALAPSPATGVLQDRTIEFREIGRIDGERDTLVGFTDLRIGPGGHILLPQPQIRRLFVFDSTGRRVRTVGRPGEGPGEFDRLGSSGWVGNDIWAADGDADRITFFTAEGAVRTFRFTATVWINPQPSDSGQTLVITGGVKAAISHNSFVAHAITHRRSSPAIRSRCTGGCIVAVDSTNTASIVAQMPPDDSLGVRIPWPGRSGWIISMFAPFVHNSIWSAAPDGSVIALATTALGDRSQPAYRVIALNPLGDTLFSRTIAHVPDRISAGAIDSAFAAKIANHRRLGVPASVFFFAEAHLGRLVPAWRQPYARMQVAMDGSVWILQRSRQTAGSIWLGLDRSGQILGTLTLPPDMQLLERNGSRAWAIRVADDGVPSVVILQLNMPG